MADIRQTSDQIQGQTLDFMRQGQDVFVKAFQAWTEGWAQAVSQFAPQGEGGPADQPIPNPQELVDQVFDFGEQLLALQREFAHRMLQAAASTWQTAEDTAESTWQQTPPPVTPSGSDTSTS